MVTHTVDQVEKSGCFRPKPIRAAICMSFAFAVTSGAFAEPLTLTWSGGETGSFSDQSWSGTAEGHLSPQDGDTLVFAGGGTFTSDIPGLEVCGKTGTAQTGKGADHAWFTCFAPEASPRLVVTVLVEGGGFGAKAAAPVAREILLEAQQLGYFK